MRFREFARNLIECSASVAALYAFICHSGWYRKQIKRTIEKRLDFLKNHKEMKFMIETSSVCNATCLFCPYKTMTRPKKIMSDAVFDKIISRIEEEGITPVSFDLFMLGEPLLDSKIFDRIDRLKKHFPKATLSLVSNFNAATPQSVERLLDSKLDAINISLNADNADSYKTLMGLDYQKTVTNILTLLKKRHGRNPRISVSAVLGTKDSPSALKFTKQWLFKADTLRFQRASDWQKKISLTRKIRQKTLYPCNDLFERLPILSNGNYALCCQDSKGFSDDKNIMNTRITDIWHSASYENIRRIHLSPALQTYAPCQNCFGTNSNGANWIFIQR